MDDRDLQPCVLKPRLCLHKDQLCMSPPLTTSGSEKESASLSMINFAIHLHMYVWIINQPLSCGLV